MKATAHHVESLDVFRGITIAAMILVNNPGDWTAVFTPLVHANWTGFTFADLVFPSFIFIMGFTMPLALQRRRTRGQETRDLHLRIARRTVMLIALGLILNAGGVWTSAAPLRIPGVLQRIALAYVIATLTVLHLEVTGWLVVLALLLVGHWALLTLVPFDATPAGTLTPDNNVARHLDALVFGRHVLATSPTDPEGLLGTLSAAATALGGALAGSFWSSASGPARRARSLALFGAVTIVIGLAWSLVLPLSKPLWTPSYALVATGIATVAFAITFLIVDVGGVRRWARPFLWLGLNPLAVYFLSELVGHVLDAVWIHVHGRAVSPKTWLVWGVIEPAIRPRPLEWASFFFSVLFVAFWVCVAGVLYRRAVRIAV